MKKFMRSLAIVMVVALSTMAVGVIESNYQNIAAAKTTKNARTKKKIKLNKKKATIRVNKTLKLKLKNAKAKKVKWSSSNKKVATVSKKGKVKARKKGKATITAKYKGKKYKCKITVKKAKKDNNVIIHKKTDIDNLTLNQAVYLADSLYENKNIIVSPMSLNMALGMAANAATPNALKDLEGYLGKQLTEYNQYSLNLMKREETDSMLTLANGIWYKNIYTINPLFSDAITKYYKGEIKAAALDMSTVDDINKWAYDNTEGMIPNVINEIPEDAVSVLANALLFKGKWTAPFKANRTEDGKFTTALGTKVDAKMMNGSVSTYFENDYATGFEKTYGDNAEYSFIGILPKKSGDFKLSDIDVESLIKTETDEYEVKIQIPKFTYSWNHSLKGVLEKTDIKSIFDEKENPMGNLLQNWPENVWVDDINQSCKIIMDEEGTKAAAVTTIIADTATAIINKPPVKTVKLDRPFAYIIKDNVTNTVMFMGKVIDTTQQ